MPQIREPVSNKFDEIELKIQKIILSQILEFYLELFREIQEIEFLFWIFMDFLTQVFL